MVMEDGAVGAAARGFARKRPRRQPRVRREPIDLERLAAEFAATPVAVAPVEAVEAPAAAEPQQILLALEAEVERVHAAQTIESPPEAEVDEPVVAEPAVTEPAVTDPVVTDPFGIHEPVARPGTDVGLPVDQVRAWLEQVEEDLRNVEARVQFLQSEQTRLQSQHQLVAELISSSTPV
jgi:hypothetical protein